MVREEFETKIQRKIFKKLWKLTTGSRVTKTRYSIRNRGLKWEIDEYHGRLTNLYTAEVELKNARQRVHIPHFLGVIADVSENREYKNKNLATKGLPASRRKISSAVKSKGTKR